MLRRFQRFPAMWLDHCRHDVRCAFRSIARSPIACAVAVISLAAGIGATTATLTLRNAIFYNPPPLYRDPGQLSRIELSTPERRRAAVPGSLYSIWIADGDLAARSAAATSPRAVALRRSEGVETVRARSIAPGFFALLGVSPALGRSCSPTPPAAGSTEVVLSHRIWQNLFEGRSDAVGREVWIDEQPHTIVGVLPPRFWFRTTDSVIWVCASPQAIAQAAAVDVVVRRGSGTSEAALAERLQRDAPEFLRRHPGELRDIRVRAMHVGGTGLGDQMAVVIPWLVGMAVLLTLLIACANVAILMFARWTSREREIAIRASLGAGRGRTMALLLTESVVLAIAGGILGVSATLVMRGLFLRNAPGSLDFDLSIDGGILLQSAFITILAGILSGLMPALYETRRLQTNPLRLLHQSDRVRQRLRHALVVMEISVTVALMVVAAGQVDASRRMLAGDIGFRTAPLLTVRVENPAGAAISTVLEAVRRVPGVASAAASTDVPMAMDGSSERVAGERRPCESGRCAARPHHERVLCHARCADAGRADVRAGGPESVVACRDRQRTARAPVMARWGRRWRPHLGAGLTVRGRGSRRRVLVRSAAATGGPVLFALLDATTGPDAGAARRTRPSRSDPARRRRPRGASATRPRLRGPLGLCVRSGDSGGRRGDHGLVVRAEPADGHWSVSHGDRHLRRAGVRDCAAVQGARASRSARRNESRFEAACRRRTHFGSLSQARRPASPRRSR